MQMGEDDFGALKRKSAEDRQAMVQMKAEDRYHRALGKRDAAMRKLDRFTKRLANIDNEAARLARNVQEWTLRLEVAEMELKEVQR